ncbi:MAG: ABC transporter permease, partial [Planctomycetaceae bacterium]|nr:ABC transporter permease [Planctomycetaceae bacterium]
MLSYLIRRLAIGALTLLLITFIVFGLIRSMPGTPLTTDIAMLDPSKVISPADYERMKKAYGLDKPWPQAYVQWVGNLLQGDMGRSFTRKRPVSTLIRERMGPTLLLSLSSLLLTYAL